MPVVPGGKGWRPYAGSPESFKTKKAAKKRLQQIEYFKHKKRKKKK